MHETKIEALMTEKEEAMGKAKVDKHIRSPKIEQDAMQ